MYPEDVIRCFFRPDKIAVLQNTVSLFKPEAFEMLRRVDGGASALGEEVRSLDCEVAEVTTAYGGRIDFLLSVLSTVCAYLAEKHDIQKAAEGTLLLEPCHELRAEAGESRWTEIGAEASSPSAIYRMTWNDVASTVMRHFNSLPRPVQLALWFNTNESEFEGGEHALRWDVPKQDVHAMELWGMSELFDAMAGRLVGKAGRDYADQADRGPAA